MPDGDKQTTPTSRTGRKSFPAHLPETLDLSSVTRPEWAAYGAWTVSAVVIRRFIDRGSDEMTFVPLSSDYIDKHIPARVRRPLLDDLISGGVLECDDLYYFNPYMGPGPGKCLCYRLGPAYRGVPIRAKPITHHELLRKMATAWAREREEVTNPVHLALRRWHDRVEVLHDAPYDEHPLLDVMNDGERRFSVCEQGRVHTNVANLPAHCRQFLRLEGRELAAVDISTSQPLILAILLSGRLSPSLTQSGVALVNPQAVLHPSSESPLNVFLSHCLDGSVYDQVAAHTRYTRDEVKKMFLAFVYGEPRDMGTAVGRAIQAEYPGVLDVVKGLYRRLGHGGLPRLMQKAESGVMIGRVAARLVRERPEMPLLTVHDCIVTPPECSDHVRQVIEEEWADEFGLAPRTKRSMFTDPQPARPKKRKPRGRKKAVGVPPFASGRVAA